MMTAQDIAGKVLALNLPRNSYIVFGSCPMAAFGLRESQDIDMLITEALHDMLVDQGWQELPGKDGDKRLARDEFDMHTNWKIGRYDPALEDLLQNAIWVNGVPFGALEEVRKWKTLLGRPKDLSDIALIDDYIKKNIKRRG